LVIIGYNSNKIVLILVARVNATGLLGIKGCKISYKIILVVVVLVGASASVEGVGEGYCKIRD